MVNAPLNRRAFLATSAWGLVLAAVANPRPSVAFPGRLADDEDGWAMCGPGLGEFERRAGAPDAVALAHVRGALSRVFEGLTADGPEPPVGTIDAHGRAASPRGVDAAMEAARSHAAKAPGVGARRVLVNLNALRATHPTALATGVGGRLLNAAEVPNARTLALHAHRTAPFGPERPPLLVVTLSANARSALGADVTAAPLTEAAWPRDLDPAGLGVVVTGARWAAVVRSDWSLWLARCARLALAVVEPVEAERVSRVVEGFLSARAEARRRVISSLGAWTVLTPGEDARAVRLLTPLRAGADARAVEGSLKSLLGLWASTAPAGAPSATAPATPPTTTPLFIDLPGGVVVRAVSVSVASLPSGPALEARVALPDPA